MEIVVDKPIRFRFAADKGKAAILWMLEQRGPQDLHTLLKSCYFADKSHLNKFHRPVFGDVYRAMKFGPVPLQIYGMLKCEPIWLAELGTTRFPWSLDGYHVSKSGNEHADMEELSKSDLNELKTAFHLCSNMSFDTRTAITHGSDWQAANLGTMKYEDMIEDGPQKKEIVDYLREAGPHMKL